MPAPPAAVPAREIGGIAVAAASHDEALALMLAAVEREAPAIFTFCNAHTVNLARSSVPLRKALRHATVFNDGIGMDIASKLLFGAPFPDNLNGTDLTPALLGALPEGIAVYLLGSPAGVAQDAQAVLAARFPTLRFAGAEHGWFAEADEPAIVERIRQSGAQLLIVGMGQPRQELWAARHAAALGIVQLCVGAYLDFAADRFPRAPLWVRQARLEWAFRLAQEPTRLAHRYLVGNAKFLINVVLERGRR
ncbi:WecB/TagA/CpsF family glycosyltransferase [Sphingomonas qilianensis]